MPALLYYGSLLASPGWGGDATACWVCHRVIYKSSISQLTFFHFIILLLYTQLSLVWLGWLVGWDGCAVAGLGYGLRMNKVRERGTQHSDNSGRRNNLFQDLNFEKTRRDT